MMLVDASQAKKRKRSGSSGPSRGVPIRVTGPRMRGGQFSSGGRGARQFGVRAGNESGFLDTAIAVYALNTTGSLTLLNPVPQGAATSQRVGKRIALKSIEAHGNIIAGNSGLSADFSYMIVYDKRPSGNLPNITDVLNTVSPYSFNNDNAGSRFQTLKRVDGHTVGGNGTTLTAKSMHDFDWFMSLKERPTVFTNLGTGAIGDIEEGAIYLITMGNEAGALAPNANVAFRLRYIDV